MLDCTELTCEPSKDYQEHSVMYSDCKSHDTFKGQVCISPTFVSHLYPGRISDKKIVQKSNFCQLIGTGDQGFKIHDLIAPERGVCIMFLPRDFLPLTSSQKTFVSRP